MIEQIMVVDEKEESFVKGDQESLVLLKIIKSLRIA